MPGEWVFVRGLAPKFTAAEIKGLIGIWRHPSWSAGATG